MSGSFRISIVTRCVLSVVLAAVSALAWAGAPHLVLDINTKFAALDSDPVWLGRVGNLVYFIARPVPATSTGGSALFKSDGTAAGTIQVAPIDGYTAFGAATGPQFIAAGTKAYFVAWTTAVGQEVWVTDGTSDGTHMVADVSPGPGGGVTTLLGLIGTDLIFAEQPSANTIQVYRTDGTAAGTRALSNFAQAQYAMVTDSVAVNGKVFVAVASYCCAPDLWVTDGTSAGTVQVDSNPSAPFHPQPSSMQAFGNSVVMLATTADFGTEPAFLNTTTDVLTILDTVPGPGDGVSYDTRITAMDGFILFVRPNVTNGLQLWRSDGTLGGTTLVEDLGAGLASSSLGPGVTVTRVGTRAVLFSQNAQDGLQLWGSDGTSQGTMPLISIPAGGTVQLNPLGVTGTHGYFAVYTGSDYRVVVTDGTPAGTHVLMDAGPVSPGSQNAVVGDDNLAFIDTVYFDAASDTFKHQYAYVPQTNVVTHLRDDAIEFEEGQTPVANGGQLFFPSTDPAHGIEPWVSDGTVAGTHIMANIAQETGTADSSPSSLTDVNGTLYFAADDGVHGAELWKSDGTPGGTSLAFDIVPGATGSNPTQLINWNGSLYFFTDNAGVWSFVRTTGPVSAVTTLASLAPEPLPNEPGFDESPCLFPRTVPFNGRLYFGASNGNAAVTLWSTDGTAGGTTPAAGNPGPPCNLTVFNGRLYFQVAGNGSGGPQLWSTDGTTAGTGPAVPNAPFAQVNIGVPLIVFNNRLYFVASDANGTNSGLYATDGTVAGTQLVKADSAEPVTSLRPVGVSNGRLVLLNPASSGATAVQELFVSDGTAGGTVQVAGVQMPLGTPMFLGANLIYFMNSDSTGVHPWVSDGTAAGTHMLVDLSPGGSADVRWFADLNGETYIASNDSTNGARIWRTDGTTVGTVVVGSSALPPLEGAVQLSGQKLFFAASDGAVGLELNVVENDAPVQAAPPPPPGGGGGGGGAGGGGGGTVGLLDLLALAGLVGLRKRRLLQ